MDLSPAQRRQAIRDHRPACLSVAEGCRVMEVARTSFYDAASAASMDDGALVERMHAIQGEFPAYGYKRITAQLRADGVPINRKRVARVMRLHGLQVRPRRQYVAATDSDHDSLVFPNLAKDDVPDGPDQLWVADITYIVIVTGFVYLAVILDVWSRRVVGYTLGRTIEARLTEAALEAVVATRRPPKDSIYHSDRGSQSASERYRKKLAEHGLEGSMGRRGNPYDNAKAESFVKTLKVEAVYRMEYESFGDVADDLPSSSIRSTTREGCTRLLAIRAPRSSRSNTPARGSKRQPEPVHALGVTPAGRSLSTPDCHRNRMICGHLNLHPNSTTLTDVTRRGHSPRPPQKG